MKRFRGVSEYEHAFASLEFGQEGIYWSNGRFAVKDDPNVAKCLKGLDREVGDAEKKHRLMIDFSPGSRGYKVFRLSPEWFSAGLLESAVAPGKNGGIPLTEVDLDGKVGLVASSGWGLAVNSEFHDYIMRTMQPDKVVARNITANNDKRVPIAYMKDGAAVAVVMPFAPGISPSGDVPLEEAYSALFKK